MAARDCYEAMGDLPKEIRITGGAARSDELRRILSSSLKAPIRISARDEAGAAAAAMMAAVAIGEFNDMKACINEWVTPLLGVPDPVDSQMIDDYDQLYSAYKACRQGMGPTWSTMASMRQTSKEQ